MRSGLEFRKKGFIILDPSFAYGSKQCMLMLITSKCLELDNNNQSHQDRQLKAVHVFFK